jgi:UDP-glucuronate 4-epimerase
MKVLVTGAAGFIGFSVAKKLLERGDDVVGFDNFNNYYDPSLKEARVKQLQQLAENGHTGDFILIRDNLANKAVVRYSLENPHSYVESNLIAFTNILEACRYAETPHLTYASTSSVYGANTTMPFSEQHGVDHPLQFYAATKRANELMAHSYSHLFKLPTTGLRFFTVYGPWTRPDMALFKFTKNIFEGKPIPVFNHGNHTRDFTYIDDIVEGIIRTSDKIATPDETWDSKHPNPSTSNAPFRIFNIGNNRTVKLIEYIQAIEKAAGKEAILDLLPLQPGDVPDTFADSSALENYVNYKPATSVVDGVKHFVDWYRQYHNI